MVEERVGSLAWLRKQVEVADKDLLREIVKGMVEALMSAEADSICGAPYRRTSSERVNRRNGYRERRWDTRVGTIDLAIPRLREGSYFPDWLLEPRRRVERALAGLGVWSSFLVFPNPEATGRSIPDWPGDSA